VSNQRKYFGDIVDIRAGFGFDLARLEGFLAQRVAGFEGPLTARQFDGGQSNPTYILDTPGRTYVLRRKPPGVTLGSAHAIDREFRVLSALFAQGFPVPEPLVYEEDEGIIGSPFYLMAHVAGRIFFDCTLPDLTPDERGELCNSVIDTLARLHDFVPDEIGLAGYGKPGNYFERQVSRWTRQYQASADRPIAAMDRLIEWLPARVPAPLPGGDRIVHGDFSFHNILIHPTEPRVVGVIDWELSTTGDPMGDLLYHTLEWYRPAGIDPRGTLRGLDLHALGFPTEDEHLARYFRQRGLTAPADYSFYRAYNLFRIAAIWQGIVAREKAGNAAASNARQLASLIEPIAEAAWAEARSSGA
jgi:aminoglycoside phosphotransferase (APT) family kinase protein